MRHYTTGIRSAWTALTTSMQMIGRQKQTIDNVWRVEDGYVWHSTSRNKLPPLLHFPPVLQGTMLHCFVVVV